MTLIRIEPVKIFTHGNTANSYIVDSFVEGIKLNDDIPLVPAVPLEEIVNLLPQNLRYIIKENPNSFYIPNGTHRALAFKKLGYPIPSKKESLHPRYNVEGLYPLGEMKLVPNKEEFLALQKNSFYRNIPIE